MFNKFALQSQQSQAKQYDRHQQLFVDRESNSLRLDEANVQSTTTGTNPNNKPGATNGIS